MSVISLQLASPSTVAVRPRGFLGRESFDVFRECIEGAKYEPEHPTFGRCQIASLDLAIDIAMRLRKAGFDVGMDEWTQKALLTHKRSMEERLTASIETARQVDERLRRQGLALYPYQRDGVAFLASRDRAILADPPGLGKTIQTLAAAPRDSGIVVICPAVVKTVWEDECLKWRPDLRLRVPSPRQWWPNPGDLQVLTYDQLGSQLYHETEALPLPPPRTLLVGDEAHYVKNRRTQRAMAFNVLSEAVRSTRGLVWLLTGTPLLKDPNDLYSILMSADLAREAFGSHKAFVALFNGLRNPFGGVVWGQVAPERTEEIGDRLKRIMLRRNKHEVLHDLPKKTHRIIRVEVSDRLKRQLDAVVEYMGGEQFLAGDFIDELQKQLFTESESEQQQHDISKFAREREGLAREKTPYALDFARGFIEEETPLVAFSAHKWPVEQLGNLAGWDKIVGSVTPRARGEIVRRFQDGQLTGVAATIAAGGVGITLTHASDVLFVDKSWTPAENLQAADRLHRIGQESAVMVTSLVADHPLDQRVEEVNAQKERMIEDSVHRAEVSG